ncbi:hypothetical protein BOTCAL_0463g00090 [Botryotinia calthae]|uniref:Uncharacterized protein n=1 Tax=Botryotinia calthae TaxID=38488 RepID=A0A4Y8CMN7_9HELO|nr:hypothetical protein BOTCAL_0463g00090 [Botryotinia calthae]
MAAIMLELVAESILMKFLYLRKLKSAVEPGIKGSDVDKANEDPALTEEANEAEVVTLVPVVISSQLLVVLVVERAVSFIEVKID